MNTSFCSGSVVHNRLKPKTHKFKYNMSWCLFDLDHIDDVFNSSKLWSLNRFNLVSIRNQDYIDSNTKSILSKAESFVEKNTHKKFNGKIFLFTHPRYLGFGFNSVNFYFCYENEQLSYILSEINNTPWKQKHIYFHDFKDQQIHKINQTYECHFVKEFHISPFVDMEIDYIWRFKITDEKINVFMQLNKNDSVLMNVGLTTQLTSMHSKNLWKWSAKKPFQALKMFTGIYWQAFKLWSKKVPFFNHPTNEIKQ
ncbi:MAG: DUF1365 domain-containing protein [Flavobacteriaceae bacterium]|nr:DUF1365 domain-containing protein [Flavobacteriaceae bacterium]